MQAMSIISRVVGQCKQQDTHNGKTNTIHHRIKIETIINRINKEIKWQI